MTLDPDDPVVLLEPDRTQVDPGGEARINVSVRNPTTIVEEYFLEVLGPAADYATVEPPRLNVMPGSNATATIVLNPPRVPPPPGGDTDFAVRCLSQLDRGRASVVEADLEVGGFKELLLQVAPTTTKGITRGKHRVVLINRGNLADRVRLSATESNDEVKFKFSQDIVEVPGPGQVEAKLKVKPHTTFLKGQPKQHRFEVAYGPILPKPGEESDVRPTTATYIQRPWLSPAIVMLLVLAAALAALVGVLLSMRDDPESEAEEATVVEPAFSTVEAAAIDSVRLSWAPIDGAVNYVIERLPAASTGSSPVAEESKDVAGDADQFVWPGLQPNTDYCFRMLARTTAGLSQPSQSKCVKTLAQATITGPSGLKATATPGTNLVLLEWTSGDPTNPQAEHIVFIDGVPYPQTFRGTTAQVEVANPEPGRSYKFEVAGLAPDGSQTAKSNAFALPVGPPPADTTVPAETTAAVTVPVTPPPVTPVTGESGSTVATAPSTLPASTTAPAETTTTATTIPVNPGFLVVLESFLVGDGDAQARAQARADEYHAADISVSVAKNTDIGFETAQEEAWVLYVDGMESREAAEALCADARAKGVKQAGSNCPIVDRS